MSDVSLETIFSSEELSVLQEFTELCQEGVLGTIGSMLGQEFQPDPIEIKILPDLTAFTQTYAPSGGISACLQMTARDAIPFVFFMDQTIGGNIANVLMGMPVDETIAEVNEIQISASGEVISQMMGAISNSASQLFSQKVDVSPPQVGLYVEENVQSEVSELADGPIVLMTYSFQSAGALPLVAISQLAPVKAIEALVKSISAIKNPAPAPAPQVSTGSSSASAPQDSITVQPVQFAPINQAATPPSGASANFELVQDILLRMSVELGRSELTIRDVLDLARGSVIELDRIAGEAVDLMANGKLIARGEIVVIEDNFGFRVTSIVSAQERLNAV